MVDDSKWLQTSQKLITNIQYWVSHGQSEAAIRAIDTYWKDWKEDHQTPPIEEAAKTLHQKIIGPRRIPSIGFIGCGENALYVYIYAGKTQWLGEMPEKWEGYPVHWQFKVGRPIAY